MKNIILISIVFLVSVSFCFAQTQEQMSKDLLKLVGVWERTNIASPKQAFEKWELSEGDQLTGIGWTMNDRDTLFIEKLSIIKKEESWYYVAEVPSNESPTFFRINAMNHQGFVCSNPDHDFPKQIEYIFDEVGMTAIISGEGKKIPFRFKKL